MIRRWMPLMLGVLLGVGQVVSGEAFVNPKANIPPHAKPQRRNAGEGFPPLPLPATPLRRSEKKREPSPPALVGSVSFSPATLAAMRESGHDWQTTVIDIETWVQFTNKQLGVRYRFVQADFSTFSYDPTELPILYFTGWKPLPRFDDATAKRLRQYLMDGGTLVVHSNCGRPEFNASFRQEIARIFPDRELAAIPTDHPIFSSFYPITEMRVRDGTDPFKTIPPYLETINIGTRAAVIFSPIDLSCGWDAASNPIPGGVLYDREDALKMGANIVTYCLAEYQYGRFFAHQKVYHQADDATRDQLVIGQIVHNGDWDPTPHGLPNLLKTIDQGTTLHVQFKRIAVDPEKADIFQFPVLYMVGQRDFQFSDKTRQRLREYLDHGGALIVDDAVGSSEFDAAFGREIKKIYPDRELEVLPEDHPIHSYVYDTRRVKLSALADRLFNGSSAPRLQAIAVDGLLPVVYSRLSMSAGWEQLPRAYNVGYADEDALRLGVNVFMYEVTH